MTSSPPEALPTPAVSQPSTGGWLRAVPALTPERELRTLQLAWLGDAVWELHQRLRRCRAPAPPSALHARVVAEVQAKGQAEALERLRPLLRPAETEVVRRGRNRAGRGPRHQEASLYGQATGFETMVGWLFLHNPARLAELLEHLEETAPLSTDADHEPFRE